MTGARGIGKEWTIIAIARRLAEILWTLLRDVTDYETRNLAGHSTGADIVTEVLAG
jgi:hypothetical protein